MSYDLFYKHFSILIILSLMCLTVSCNSKDGLDESKGSENVNAIERTDEKKSENKEPEEVNKMNEKCKQTVEYVKSLFEVSFEEKILDADMELVSSPDEEDTARIRMKIPKDSVASVEKELQKVIEEGESVDASSIPRYQGHLYAEELKKMSIRRRYYLFTTGKIAKTRDINIYLAENDEYGYIYIFG